MLEGIGHTPKTDSERETMNVAAREASTAPAITAEPVRFGQKTPIQALWIASLVSIFGNSLTALAVPWFVLETTGSASRTGITAAVTIIPIVIANFFGGALVDRTGYRVLSIFSDLVSACLLYTSPSPRDS